MCPVTLAVIAAGANIAGTGVSAYGQIQQGKYEEKVAKYQADINRQRAGEVQEQAGQESIEQAQRRRAQIAAARVAGAAGGSMLDANPDDSIQRYERDVAYVGAYDTAKLSRNAELASWGFLTTAGLNESEGKMARWSGNMGATGTLIGGAGSALGYASQAVAAYKASKAAEAGGFDYSGVEN